MQIERVYLESMDLGLDLNLNSPFPWTIGTEYEQSDPGYYIYDAQGNVLFSEDVEPTEADRNLIIVLLMRVYQ